MHGLVIISIDMDVLTTLEMMKFLRFEGKAGFDGNGKPISYFEYRLYNACHKRLLDAATYEPIEYNFLIGIVLSDMDSYDDSFVKV